jgi:hypothetical protein
MPAWHHATVGEQQERRQALVRGAYVRVIGQLREFQVRGCQNPSAGLSARLPEADMAGDSVVVRRATSS